MVLKKNNPGCNCCNAVCSVTCNKRLYFGVTGVTANFACDPSTGGSSIIAIGDAFTPAFFNSNTWYWDPAWVTGSTPGLEDLADGYSIGACNTILQTASMAWFYVHDGVIGGQPAQISALASVVVYRSGGVLNVDLRFQTLGELINPPFTRFQSNLVETWRYSGLCPTGTPTLHSRVVTNTYCLDFNPSTTFMTWV